MNRPAPKPGRTRWVLATAAVLWLAPSTVSTGRIAGEPLHVDAAVLGTPSKHDDRRLHGIDNQVIDVLAAMPGPGAGPSSDNRRDPSSVR